MKINNDNTNDISSNNDGLNFNPDVKLYNAYKKYDTNLITDKDLWSQIKDLTNDNFLRYYLFAKHMYEKVIATSSNDIKKTIDSVVLNIEKAELRDLKLKKLSIIDSIGNAEYHYWKEKRNEFYFLAGEIYAFIGYEDRALYWFKKYHYTNLLLKSEFKKEISLFSFRNITKYAYADLLNRTITVSHPIKMNDPFDSIFLLWANSQNLKSLCERVQHIETYSKSFDYFRIRSFSKCNYKDTLMWSHYGEEHTGFCIKYRLSEHFINEKENESNSHMYLRSMDYTCDDIKLCMKTIDSRLAFTTKHSKWKYEKEIRLISYNPNIEGHFDSISLDENSNIDAIYFGYKCQEQDIITIKNICEGRYKGIKFYKMKLNPENVYKMNIEKI